MREIMVHAWYPASVTDEAEAAPYRPLARDRFQHVVRASVAGAAFAEGGPRPAIILCPGRGMPGEAYTTLAEDLASRGYAVFAVDSPYTGRVTYPDSRTIPPAARFRVPFEVLTGPYEHVDAFFEEAVAMASQDIFLALRQLGMLNRHDPAGRFTGQLDLDRIGLFGHSLGGRVCGEVAGRLRSVRAYASMEGVPPRAVRQGGRIRASILLMYSSELPDMALPNLREAAPHRQSDVFLMRLEGLGHNSNTDLPLLGDASYQVSPTEGLRLSRLVLAGFFDAYLRGGTFPSEAISNEAAVTIEAYRKP